MTETTRPRMTPPSAAQAQASLLRTFGDPAGRMLWDEACRRAGVAPAQAEHLPVLLKVADAMTGLGGPAAASGVSLVIRIRAFQAMEKRAAQEAR